MTRRCAMSWGPVVMFYFFGFCYYFNNISTIISNIYNQIHRSFVRNFCDMEIHSRTCQHQREQKKDEWSKYMEYIKMEFCFIYFHIFFSFKIISHARSHFTHTYVLNSIWILPHIGSVNERRKLLYTYISMRTREYKIMAKLVHITKLTAIINQKRSKNYDRKCCWKQRKSSAHIHGVLERNAKVDEFQF